MFTWERFQVTNVLQKACSFSYWLNMTSWVSHFFAGRRRKLRWDILWWTIPTIHVWFQTSLSSVSDHITVEEDSSSGGVYLLLRMQKYGCHVLSPFNLTSLNLLSFHCDFVHKFINKDNKSLAILIKMNRGWFSLRI